MMAVVVSVVACLRANPAVCEPVQPDYVHQDGSPISLGECLGPGGQDVLKTWLTDHPDYVLAPGARIRCTITNDPKRTLRELRDTPA